MTDCSADDHDPHRRAQEAIAAFAAARCPDCGMMPNDPAHAGGCPDGPLWEPEGTTWALEAAHMSYHRPTIAAEEEAWSARNAVATWDNG